jgi:hypothetical protein
MPLDDARRFPFDPDRDALLQRVLADPAFRACAVKLIGAAFEQLLASRHGRRFWFPAYSERIVSASACRRLLDALVVGALALIEEIAP